MSTEATVVSGRRLGARYELLLAAFVVSSLGNWIYRLALPLLVYRMTGSALNTAVVSTLEYAPLLLLSLPGGVFADRFDRRRILVTGDLVATALAGILALIVSAGSSILLVYLVAFLLACVEPLYYPAFQGMLPDLVPGSDLDRANSWMQMGDNVMSLAGPAVAGALVGALGYQSALWADAGSFAASAVAILAIRTPARPGDRQGSGFAREIAAAVAYIMRRNRFLLTGAILFALTNFATWLVQANLVYYLSHYRGMSPGQIGVVFAAQGLGAALGATACPWLAKRFPPGRIIIAGTVTAGLGIVALIPLRDVVTISLLWALIYGIGIVNTVSWFVLRQRTVPAELLGRVVATTRMIAFMSIPVASLLGGLLEQYWHNMYLIITIGGGLRLVVGVVALTSPLNSHVAWYEEPEP